MNETLHFAVSQFLYKKSELCDAYDWDAYLDLYDESCEYHIPMWIDDHTYVKKSNEGLSYIYYEDRTGLEDRVFRIRTGKAASASVLPRTLHMLSNIIVNEISNDEIEVRALWQTLYDLRGVDKHFFGRVTYLLKRHDNSFKIYRQHTILLNDKIDSVLDFYHV